MCDYKGVTSGGAGVLQEVFRYILVQLGEWDGFQEKVVVYGY